MEDTSIQYNLLKKAFDPAEFRKQGHTLVDMIADYIESVQNDPTQKVLPYQEPEDMHKIWKEDLQTPSSDISETFKKIIDHSIHVHHPRYIGHQVTSPALIASLSGLLSDVLNNGSAVYEMGMTANAMEKIITDLLADKIGFDEDPSGFITSGGTLANLTALLAARREKVPTVWQYGYQEKLAVMVSEEAHYCIDRAARILGMGEEGVIKIPVDEQFKIKTDVLESHYQNAVDNGYKVIAIVGCSCSTSTGSYDDLEAIGHFASRHNLWFHVDGAHGGAVIFSEKYKHLVKGIDQADSVVIDFHKMMMTPSLNTALVFKNAKTTYQTFVQKAHYLWDEQETKEWYNGGKRTFECTKGMMIIKVYSLLKSYGTKIFEQNINALHDISKDFVAEIKSNANFEVRLEQISSNIVNFRYINTDINLNDINNRLRELLIKSGKFYIVQTRIKDEVFLRVTIINPLTTMDDLKALLQEIEQIAETL